MASLPITRLSPPLSVERLQPARWKVVGQWLTAPSPRVVEADLRRQAQLLSAVLLILILLLLGSEVATVVTYAGRGEPYSGYVVTLVCVAALAAAYALSRTAFHVWGALLMSVTTSVTGFAYAVGVPESVPQGILYYLIIPLLLASAFLPIWPFVLFCSANLAALALSPLFLTGVSFGDVLIGALSFFVLSSGIILVLTRHRDNLERDRSASIRQANELLRRQQSELRTSAQRFKALFEQAAVGVALVEATTGRFVQVNHRVCEILGRDRQELEALTFAAITHPHDLEASLQATRQIIAGVIRELVEEKRYLRKDGSEVWAAVTISAMWAPGDAPDYMIAVIQDITEQKTMQEQLRQSQKMQAIGTLAGGIAHDFNNVLASINGYTELARIKLKDNVEVRGYLSAVLQASGRATDMVRQILTFSRQEQPERRPIELRPIIEETLAMLRARIPLSIEFDATFATDTPVVLADATQIHQVFMNLGANAWHAMGTRPGRLQVQLKRCVIDATFAAPQAPVRPGVYACVSVGDSGRGMDPATLQRIFEPFFTTKPVGEGTGLGLSVVHGIMASHDGAITVYSERGQGTVFNLYFPAFAGEATALATEDDAVVPGHGERILFVDDEELLVQLGVTALTMIGYDVEGATASVAALAMVRADPLRFALVITDQTMPGMAGEDLAARIRQIQPTLPIILMTGYGMSLSAGRLEAAGIHQLLIKPVPIRSLAVAIRAALSLQPLRQASCESC